MVATYSDVCASYSIIAPSGILRAGLSVATLRALDVVATLSGLDAVATLSALGADCGAVRSRRRLQRLAL